jgi:hypothetical protein
MPAVPIDAYAVGAGEPTVLATERAALSARPPAVRAYSRMKV